MRICDIVAEGFSPGVLQRLGPGLRRDEEDPAGHHLYPAGRHGRAWHLWADADRGAGCRGVRRPGGHVGLAGTGDAGGVGVFLPRLDGRLWLRAGAAGCAVSPGPHRRRPVDRCVPVRIRAFPDRHIDPGLVGERAGVASLRQPLALQAGRAAWCLSVQGPGPLGGHRLLHRGGVAGAGARRRPCRVAGRQAFCDPGGPAGATRMRSTRRSVPGPRRAPPRTS